MVFERLQSEVIRAGLCTHCGMCVGLSGGHLEMQLTDRGPLPVAAGAEPVCLPDLAYEACPGRGLNYPDLNQAVFGCLPDNWLIGTTRGVYIGYSAVPEIRRRGASGGVITQTLVYLLENGLIDGAVVVQQGRWLAEPVIACSADEIIAAAQSVYVPVAVNAILPQMETCEGRLAYVGLPDQVAALRKLQQLGHPGALKVDYVLGPYVGTIMYLSAIESYLRSNGVRRVEEVTELRYREGEWPGYLQIKTQSGKVLRAEKFYYNYLIPFYITRSTLLAVDFTNELTDISVGDAWHPDYEKLGQGFSVVVARSEKGENMLRAMQAAGVLFLDETTVERAIAMHGHMIDFKKRGAFIRMGWRKALGQRVPDYGYHPRHLPLSRKLVEVIVTGLFVVAGTGPARRVVEHIPIRILGPLFNTLRVRWKEMSKPVKRKGLSEVDYDLTPTHPLHAQRGGINRLVQGAVNALRITVREVRHWTRATWTFEDVAVHWDATEDYDAINEETYSYFRRFVDGLRLSDVPDGGHILDFCARTGNGTLYFYQHGKIGSAVCADVSVKQGEICQRRLREGGFTNFEWIKVVDYKLPFEDGTFDAVLNFETVEHFPEPALMIDELARVTKPGGTLILTTPNVLWEPVHALAAIMGAHHSEGPHRFIRYGRLVAIVKRAGFEIGEAETTVLIPGGPGWLVKFGEWIEVRTGQTLMPWLGLRRVLICRKK